MVEFPFAESFKKYFTYDGKRCMFFFLQTDSSTFFIFFWSKTNKFI